MTPARPLAALLLVAALAACGVDGPPERPETRPATPSAAGVTLTGSVAVGVSGGD